MIKGKHPVLRYAGLTHRFYHRCACALPGTVDRFDESSIVCCLADLPFSSIRKRMGNGFNKPGEYFPGTRVGLSEQFENLLDSSFFVW